MKESEGQEPTQQDLSELLSSIYNILISSLVGESIEEVFAKRVMVGNLYAQEVYKQYSEHESEGMSEINISFFDKGYSGDI